MVVGKTSLLPKLCKLDSDKMSVFITHAHAIQNSEDVHIFVVPTSNKEVFEEIIDGAKDCEKLDLEEGHLKLGPTYCLASYCDTWARGISIPNAKGDKFKVFFIDYGNTEMLSSECIKEIPASLAAYDTQCIHCVLQGKLNTKKFKLKELLNTWLLGTYQIRVCEYNVSDTGRPHPIVDLYKIDKKKNSVVYLNESFMIPNSIEQGGVQNKEPEYKRLTRGELAPHGITRGDSLPLNPYKVVSHGGGGPGVDVVHGVLSVADAPDTMAKYDAMNAAIHDRYGNAAAADHSSGYEPAVDDLVISHYENEWFRGVCEAVDVGSRTAAIRYLEYGNRDDAVPYRLIRAMPPRFNHLPPLIVHMVLDGVAPGTPIGTLPPRYSDSARAEVMGVSGERLRVRLWSADGRHCLNDELAQRQARATAHDGVAHKQSQRSVNGGAATTGEEKATDPVTNTASSAATNHIANRMSPPLAATSSPPAAAITPRSLPSSLSTSSGTGAGVNASGERPTSGGSIRQDIHDINTLLAQAMDKMRQLEAKIG